MKQHASFFLVMLALVACKKDDTEPVIRFTSDVPDEFTTTLNVAYDQNENLTTARAYFKDQVPGSSASSQEMLKLPEGSYVNINGLAMTSELSGGTWLNKEFAGNADALFEFMNFDQTLYSNLVDMPDTAFLVNLPDTIDASQNLTLTFDGTPMESGEILYVNLSVNNDYGDFAESTTDSTIVIPKGYLRPGMEQELMLTRVKTLDSPNLPVGGGAVTCSYRFRVMIYSE